MSEESRSALVMASTKGLGFASARALGQAGLRVAICGRTELGVGAALHALRVDGIGQILGLVGDVSVKEELETIHNQAVASFGPLDTLVINTGGPRAGSFLDLDDGAWDVAIQSLFLSAIWACGLVLPHMIEVGFGRIVVIGSSSVRRPIPGLTLSNVLRPALNGLVKDLAVDFAGRGVTVNMVAPGRIDTERVRDLDRAKARRLNQRVEETRAEAESAIPHGRYGRAEELASVVSFLVSPEAGYVTGQTILVDGGLTASHP
jgi:3-oxoacyl-[acyl-carrier protein] reductase